MKLKTDQQKALEKIIKWQDICSKSYDGEHVWAEGSLFTPITVFNFILPINKIVQKLFICRACGTVKRN